MMLTAIAANASKYVLNTSAPAQSVPETFKGTIAIKAVKAIIEKETKNDKYRYAALRCDVLLQSTGATLDLWLPVSVVTLAVMRPDTVFTAAKGKAYVDKDQVTQQRVELTTEATVTNTDVSLLMSALAQRAMRDMFAQKTTKEPETTNVNSTNDAKSLENVTTNGDNPPEADTKKS